VAASGVCVLVALAKVGTAQAQYPQQQPYPQQAPYPQQPAPGAYPQQPYPQQQQQQQAPYPPQQPPYPQQPYPQQPYPGGGYPAQQPAQQPYPQAPQYGPAPGTGQPYGPQQPYPQQYPAQQPYPPPQLQAQPGAPAPSPATPPPSKYRSPGEMVYLYGISAAYGVGTGIWIDSVAGIGDPGIALIAPVVLGGALPIGAYVWDTQQEFDRGVPASMATGMLLGGVEGIAVDGLQWQLTGNGGPDTWKFSTWTSVAFLGATAGGIGGYAFGEWLQPDPRSLAFVASGAGWGSMAGILLGAGAVSADHDWANGAAVGGFIGYNAGIVATGAISTVYTPSWQTLKYMWFGDLIGTVATTPVYLFYIGGGDARHGMIANAVGGLAGLGIAAALTGNMTDTASIGWKPPFQLAVSPTRGGLQASAFGQF
jgi:hypothetical protein